MIGLGCAVVGMTGGGRLGAQEGEGGYELAQAGPVSLDWLLAGEGLFGMSTAEVEKGQGRRGFKWLSETARDRGTVKRFSRWVGGTGGEGKKPVWEEAALTILDGKEEVVEGSVEFAKEGKVSGASLILFSKSDVMLLGKVEFEKRLADLRAGLDAKFKVKGTEMGKDATSAAKAQRVLWKGTGFAAQLEWSVTKKERTREVLPEFIRLRLLPLGERQLGARTAQAGGQVAKVGKGDLVKRVVKSGNGDVMIEGVPMVDQGEKGYCSVASAERVFRYYGIECDQHDMAQIAGTQVGGGTSSRELEASLDKLEARFKIHMRRLWSMDVREFLGLASDYNREAKRAGKKLIETNSSILYISLAGLDPDALRKARGSDATTSKLRRQVKDYINRGVPILWGLQMGLYAENGKEARQAGGGHMRLLIGYNEEKEEFIFTDSWGPGHEQKRISQVDAMCATHGLYIIEPGGGR